MSKDGLIEKLEELKRTGTIKMPLSQNEVSYNLAVKDAIAIVRQHQAERPLATVDGMIAAHDRLYGDSAKPQTAMKAGKTINTAALHQSQAARKQYRANTPIPLYSIEGEDTVFIAAYLEAMGDGSATIAPVSAETIFIQPITPASDAMFRPTREYEYADLRKKMEALHAKYGDNASEIRDNEDIAKFVYVAMQWAVRHAENGRYTPSWQEHGNSNAQEEARRCASVILNSTREPVSLAHCISAACEAWRSADKCNASERDTEEMIAKAVLDAAGVKYE